MIPLAFFLAMFALPVAIITLAFLLAAHDHRRRRGREHPEPRHRGGIGE
jgi:hypothetical protein